MRNERRGRPAGAYRELELAALSCLDDLERRSVLVAAFRDHGGPVYDMTLQIGGAALAAEVTSEAFLHVWRHPDCLDPSRGSARARLVEIARNRAIALAGPEHPGSDEAPKAPVAAAIDRLAPEERAAVETTLYGQCSYRETAGILGVTDAAAALTVRAALQKLGRALRDPSHQAGPARPQHRRRRVPPKR